eukprot:9435637-Pyramimonas_sp.AAC.1
MKTTQAAISKERALYYWGCVAVHTRNVCKRRIARIEWHSENLTVLRKVEKGFKQRQTLWKMQVAEIRLENSQCLQKSIDDYKKQLATIKRRNDDRFRNAQQSYEDAVAEVEAHNMQVIPKILRVNEVNSELSYVEGFLKQIKIFAGEHPDRVVEM